MRLLDGLPRALVVSAVLFAGCGSDGTTTNPTCDPVCREGFVCSRGTCVSSCNPACRSNEACVASGASFTCAPLGGDAQTPTDATTPDDSPMPADVLTPPKDVPPGMDVQTPPTDVPMPTDTTMPTDATMPPGDTGRVPCGAAGQGCCFTRACDSGNECIMGTCRAYTRAMGECGRSAECTMGQQCAGPDTCGTMPGHGCWVCTTTRGMAAFGAACTTSDTCASGVCRFGHCSVPCTVGAAGDAECRALGANQVCTELTYSVMSGASLVTLGVCARTCGRNGDCTSPELCVPTLNYLNDRYDFVCATIQPGSMRTGIAGAPCTDGNTCQSALCVPSSTGMGGTCTAFCATAADCPPGAPVCGDLPLLRPSNGIQLTHGCMPR